jgi:lactosylceramide 4-alpha-galactosyltransferase
MKVFVSFVSRHGDTKIRTAPELSAILSYPNVYLNYFDLAEFAAGSPLEDFLKSKKLLESNFTVSHTSDALRYLMLWKFGGSYLDTGKKFM